MKMNIKDWAIKNDLDWQPIDITITRQSPDEDWRKVINHNVTKALQDDFRNGISQEELEQRRKVKASHIAIHTDKNLCVIDVDFKVGEHYSDESKAFVESLKEILPYKKSNSKELGYHFYFIADGQTFPLCRNEHIPYPDIEILAGQWAWERLDSNIRNAELGIPTFKIPNYNNELNKMESESTDHSPSLDPSIVEMILNIPKEKVYTYPAWFKTLVMIKTKFGEEYKDIADELSKKAGNKKYGKFNETWDKIKVKKTSNNLDDVFSPAQDFYALFGKNCVVNNYEGKNEVYCYCERTKLWKRDDKLCRIKYNIGIILTQKYSSDLITENNENLRKKKLRVLADDIDSNSFRQDIANTFICEVLGNQDDNVKFDSIDYLYHFKNTTLDLRTMTFRSRIKEDYCSMFACHLHPKNENKIKVWDEIITSIFPNPEMKKTYLDIIINSFSGVVLQKFIIFNGSGSNGKGMLDNCFKLLHGHYYYKGACSDLCQPVKGGSNPSLANCNKKRFCVYTEPNEKDKLQVSTIKDMTGEDTINARKNYSNDTETKMGGLKIIECNKRCKLDGDTGYSIERRLIDLLFESTFKTPDGVTSFDVPYDKDTNPKGYHNANTLYETNEWREEHCSDLFHYLYDYMIDNDKNYKNLSNFIVCKAVKDRTTAYIHDNNSFLALINTYCEKSKDDYITIKDLLFIIKDDIDRWNLMSKNEKREMTVNKLKAKIQDDPQLSHHYIKRKKVNSKDIYNVILNYKFKPLNDSDDEEENF